MVAEVMDNMDVEELPPTGQPDISTRQDLGMYDDESVYLVEIPFMGIYKANVIARDEAHAITTAETFVKKNGHTVDICCGHVEKVEIG